MKQTRKQLITELKELMELYSLNKQCAQRTWWQHKCEKIDYIVSEDISVKMDELLSFKDSK